MKPTLGFSLLEVVVALFVLSIGIMAVASLQVSGRKLLSGATQNLNNSISAVAFLEQVIGLNYNDPHLVDTDGHFDPNTPDHGPEPIPNTNSTIEWEVDDDFPVKHSKRITITIRRSGPGGLVRSMRYDYIKCLAFI